MNKYRKDFPQYTNSTSVYLDSAASSLTPASVLDAMDEYYRAYRSNIHRGLYKEAEKATSKYESVREKVARFIGADPQEVVFTAGATHASNMLMYSIEQSLDLMPGDEVIVSEAEHHASLVPLQMLAKRKDLVIRSVPLTSEGDIDIDIFQSLLSDKTRIIAVMLASNVLGTVFNIGTIARLARKSGALLICDATAAAGHVVVDVKKLGVDCLYFSGHKMCGPTGVGVLYVTKDLITKLQPSYFGGGMVSSVSLEDVTFVDDVTRFEAGTAPIAEVIGLGAAISYVQSVGLKAINNHVQETMTYLLNKLENVEGISVYAMKDVSRNVGIASFTIDGVHPHDVAQVLADEGVAVRAGHHCAMPLVTSLGMSSVVRASVYVYTTNEDIDRLTQGLEKVKSIFS